MPLRVLHEPSGPAAVRGLVISCEVCGQEVDDQQLKDGGGLVEMGWSRRFNNRPEVRRNEYFCPEHK